MISHLQVNFFHEVIEGIQDGILIATDTGNIVYSNTTAQHICRQLQPESQQSLQLPPSIQKICSFLIENKSLFPNQTITLSDEILVDQLHIFRVRVRFLELKTITSPYILITIENCYESIKNTTFSEIKQYNLTQRESEIWSLYRAKYSYKEIAQKFFISLNTVKKHMKNIHAKRHAFLELQHH
ncbi:hypothetical protein IJ00_22200 [Calothrix sp. 336/3]|nr:hypothetical protein IJ00_22200 [Calothrix sp. 336/3]